MTQAQTGRGWLLRLWPLVPIAAALIFTSGLLLLFDASPTEAYRAMWDGAFGGQDKILGVLAFWVPMLLASTGLIITFTAGLWNIGVEGQIILGAICASWVALRLSGPAWVLIPLEIGAAMLGGALWAGLSAVLKTRGKVNEIFSGLALNNLAIILTNYLISGPWQPPEGGSFRGTTPFQEAALLPRLWESRFSPLSLILATIAIIGVYYIPVSYTHLDVYKRQGLGRFLRLVLADQPFQNVFNRDRIIDVVEQDDAGDGRRRHLRRADVEHISQEGWLHDFDRLYLADGHFHQLDAEMAQFELVVGQMAIGDQKVVGAKVDQS